MPTTYAIPNGRTVMDATLYTGDGTTGRLIQNTDQGTTGFKPDLVWIKSRSNALNNNLYDSNRGAPNEISSNTTSGDTSGDLTAFNTTGFTINQTAGYEINHSGYTYVGWQWQSGQGTNVSNTSGTITSSVSANTTAGFSIVTYVGTGVANATIGHGLGATPALIIWKNRASAGTNWITYHTSLGVNQYIYLNLTSNAATLSNVFGVSSTTFTVGTTSPDYNGTSMVAYCWTPIAGYSQFGSYTGNGSTDGPFVYLGFRPRFLLIKSASIAATDWLLYDSVRNTGNVENSYLQPNTSAAEGTYALPDFLSNGFKIRNTGANTSGETVIYAAFAENPFKYANAR